MSVSFLLQNDPILPHHYTNFCNFNKVLSNQLSEIEVASTNNSLICCSQCNSITSHSLNGNPHLCRNGHEILNDNRLTEFSFSLTNNFFIPRRNDYNMLLATNEGIGSNYLLPNIDSNIRVALINSTDEHQGTGCFHDLFPLGRMGIISDTNACSIYFINKDDHTQILRYTRDPSFTRSIDNNNILDYLPQATHHLLTEFFDGKLDFQE